MAKTKSKGLGAWLKNNLKILTWVSTVPIALIGSAWQIYVHFEKRTEDEKAKAVAEKAALQKAATPAPTPSAGGPKTEQKAEANNGGIAINAAGDVTVNK